MDTVSATETSPQPRPLLKVRGLKRYFDVSKPLLNRLLEGQPRVTLKAVSGVDFEIHKGRTFALVGESGCGKSTVANLVVGLHPPTSGKIEFAGVDMSTTANRAQMTRLRQRLAMIFQDPYASLNPRWRVAAIVSEPIRAFGLLSGARAISRCAGMAAQAALRQTADPPSQASPSPRGGQRSQMRSS